MYITRVTHYWPYCLAWSAPSRYDEGTTAPVLYEMQADN